MKKIILIVLLFISIESYSQFQFGIYGGVKTSISLLNMGYRFKPLGQIEPIISLGYSITAPDPRRGKNYTNIIDINSLRQDLVRSNKEYLEAYHLDMGFRYRSFEFLGRIGLKNLVYFENRVDNSRILSSDGNYHITFNNEHHFMSGGLITYYPKNHWGFSLGYDNFNHISIGVKAQINRQIPQNKNVI